LARDGVVVIVDDETGVGAELAHRLGQSGHRAVRIVSDTAAASGADIVASDLGDPAAVSELVGDLSENYGGANALVHLSALGSVPRADLTGLFLLAGGLRADLEAAATAGGAAVLGATSMGGTFAADAPEAEYLPDHGAIPGSLKT